MRTIAPFRTIAASAFLIAGVVLGTAAPAAADPPELRFENFCGGVAFAWDTGTIGGDDRWATTVLRGTVVIDEFLMGPRGSRTFGATDGDVFEIRREGLPERSFVHEAPDGCTTAPALTVRAASDCDALRLTFVNAGTTPVTGLQLLADGVAPHDLAAIAPGEHTRSIGLSDRVPFMIRGPRDTGGYLTWFSGVYNRPESCATPSTPGTPSSPAGSPGGSLPVTGADAKPIWIGGTLLASAGVLLLLATRRRRSQAG